MKSGIIYSPEYDMTPPGAGFIHPFDGKKYSRAWSELNKNPDLNIESVWQQPEKPLSDDVLLDVHTSGYLASLDKSSVVSKIIEIPFLGLIPNGLLQRYFIKPMRWACEGTILATRTALEGAMVMNIGGGYHHAHADHGEGFCVFADVAVAISTSRKKGELDVNDKIVMIDLDAHRGNGFESVFREDSAVSIFDMYNFQVYPGMHKGELDDHPYMIPLKNKTNDDTYLKVLKEDLPEFMSKNGGAKLAFYNAGTDILAGDPLGNLNISYDGVIERDRFVIELLSKLNIPTVVVTSGGYTKTSYKLVTNLAKLVISH
jgi:histone deacetylase 11